MKEIYLYSGVYSFSSEMFMREMDSLNNEDVVLRVNSGGGSMFSGVGMLRKMMDYEGKITAKVDGVAASMASAVLLFADEVEVLDISRVLLHRGTTGSMAEDQGDFMRGLNDQFKALYDKKIDKDAFKRVTGYTLDQLFDFKQRIDIWLNGEQLKEIGLADRVINLEPTQKEKAEAALNAAMSIASPNNQNFFQQPKANSFNNYQQQSRKSKPMNTLTELQAQHPELYEKAVALGAKQESERVKTWMAYEKIDLDAVRKGIESGEEITASQRETLMLKAHSVNRKNDLHASSAKDFTPEASTELTDEQKAQAAADAKKAEDFEKEIQEVTKDVWN